MISVPPTVLKLTNSARRLVDSKEKAESFWHYALLNREAAVIVDDEVVAGELLIAACILLNITHVNVLQVEGNPESIRNLYTDLGLQHGAPIPD